MLLDVQGLTAGYGAVTVVDGVSLTVEPGEIVCLIGPNGAGKSTVLRAVAGQLRPTAGKVIFDGAETERLDPMGKARRGLIFIPQGENVFPNLTVRENLDMAAYDLRDSRLLEERIQRVYDAFPFLRERRRRPARELSGGQRQALALSRILLTGPKLVLLDEPSLGLAPMVVDEIFDRIQALNREGISFLIVEQNARKGLSVSHRGYVLEQGKNRLAGTGSGLLDDERVQKLYLGG